MQKTYTSKRYRVDIQVFIMTAVLVVISCGITFFMSYHLTYNGMLKGLEQRASSIHNFADERLDSKAIASLTAREDENTKLYKDAREVLAQAREAAGVQELYMVSRKEDGSYIYTVDSIPVADRYFEHCGDAVSEEYMASIERAMSGESVLPKDVLHIDGEELFTAYYPMHEDGKVYGVLAMEFDASRQYKIYGILRFSAPLIICVFCLISAIIAVVLFRRISNPRFKDMSVTDFLTGLKNRNSFEVDLYNLNNLRHDKQILIISADLNNLKKINDEYGHVAGDCYIKMGTEILQECRETIVGGEGVLYRIGGDEFVMVLDGSDITTAEAIKNYIVSARKTSPLVEGVYASMSVGYALFDSAKDRTLKDTFKRADARMYEMKKEVHRSMKQKKTD